MVRKWTILAGALFATCVVASPLAFAHWGRPGGSGPGHHRPPGPGSLVESFDSNKDGSISSEELAAGLTARQAESKSLYLQRGNDSQPRSSPLPSSPQSGKGGG